MKKALKRTLAILLAALMVLGIGTTAGAAPAGKEMKPPAANARTPFAAQALQSQGAATLTIDTPPTNTDIVLETRGFDLSGLVVTLTCGTFSKTIAYDDLTGEEYYGIDWDLDWDLTPGPCELRLYAWAYDADVYYNTQTSLTCNVVSLMTPGAIAGAAALTEGAPAAVSLTAADTCMLFKFTPSASGLYVFASKDHGEGVDPYGLLYADEPQLLAFDDDGGGNRNFRIIHELEAGQTYYLLATSYRSQSVGGYTVTVKAYEAPSLTIDTPPDNINITKETYSFSLSGLVMTLAGGTFSKTIAYDDLTGEENYGIDWDLDWDYASGPCDLLLYAWAYDAAEDAYHYAQTSLTLNVVSLMTPGAMAAATALALDIPTPVSLTAADTFTLFKFVPAESGMYVFASKDYGEDVDPLGLLYSDEPRLLYRDDDGYGLNFLVRYYLEEGKTYYLLATSYRGYSVGSYTLTVSFFEATLTLSADAVTVNYHDYLDLWALLDGTSWDFYDLDFDWDNEILQWEWDWDWGRLYGAERGTTNLVITAPDGSSATVKVTVEYSFVQWLCVIFLFGWYWMPYTSIGPFSLLNEIGRLEGGLLGGIQYFLLQLFAPVLVMGRALLTPGAHSMHKLYSGEAPKKILILGNSFIWTSDIENALENLLDYNDRALEVEAVGIGYAEVKTFLDYVYRYPGIATGAYDAVFVCGFYGSSHNELAKLAALGKGTKTQFVIFPAPNEQPFDSGYAWVKNRGVDYLGWYDLVHYLWERKGFAFEELAVDDYHAHSNEAAGYLAAMAVYTYLYGELPEQAVDAGLFDLLPAWEGLTQEQLLAKIQTMRDAVNDMVLKASRRYYAETLIDWYKNVF